MSFERSLFKNYAEGQITCTTEGKPHLRGVPRSEDEKLDVLIPNSDAVVVRDVRVEKVVGEDGSLLTDHFAVSAELEIV